MAMDEQGREGRLPRVGILGGGQLARMTVEAANRLGIEVVVLEAEAQSPAGQLAYGEVIGLPDDPRAGAKLAGLVDVVTLENEFVDPDALLQFSEQGVAVFPSPETLAAVQDKLRQKTFFAAAGIAVPAFRPVLELQDIITAGEELGWPVVVKARRNGYDGRGNVLAEDVAGAERAWETLGAGIRPLMVEAFVAFSQELAVMVARGRDGSIACYPVVETVQRNHICHTVSAPARVPQRVADEATELAVHAVEAVDGVGIFGVEMFLTFDGEVLLNEFAPRPHNSGHFSIEACHTSQFENHLRAVLGLPLGDPGMVTPAAAMVNILGKREGTGVPGNLAAALAVSGASVHLYGKLRTRPGRKMGHVTALAATVQDALDVAGRAAQLIDL